MTINNIMINNILADYKQIIFLIIAALNVISCILVGLDKQKARLNKLRISEKTFFILAVCFGATGVYAGMLIFHHKTKKWYFQFGIPLLLILNLYLFDLFLYGQR